MKIWGIVLSALTMTLVFISELFAQPDWKVYRLHPFVESTADQLSQHFVTAATKLTFYGLQNDWVHESIAIVATGQKSVTVTIDIEGPKSVINAIEIRAVGFIKQKDLGYVLDPILKPLTGGIPSNPWRCLRNFEGIRYLPKVTATAIDPVVIWITVRTHGLSPGHHRAILKITDQEGQGREVLMSIIVGDYKLPTENPLYGYGWQWAPEGAEGIAWLSYFKEYGINVTHITANFDEAKEAGYKFFLFVFGPSWAGKSFEEVPLDEVKKALEKIRADINRLQLKPQQWAVVLYDEPGDQVMPKVVTWANRLREMWPEIRFWSTVPWGPRPEMVNKWATVEGTFKPLAKILDFWCPYSFNLWDEEADQHLSIMRASGKPIWFYDIWGMSASRRPQVGRQMLRLGPWIAWKYRLQGFAWYALNEYSDDDPWSDQSASECYACVYPPAGGYQVPVPSRGFEAVRQGFQEYKRLYELHRLGVEESRLDAFAERVIRAKSVQEIDQVRMEMDELLLRIASRKRNKG